MRRRRTRRNSTWFPNLGITVADESHSAFYAYNRSTIQPNLLSTEPPSIAGRPGGSGFPSLDYFALIPDQTALISAHNPDFSLRDYVEGQDWFLDSIVGSIHVATHSVATDGGFDAGIAWGAVAVTAAFFVASADEQSTTQIDLADYEFNPSNVDNVRAPWIWRRTWVLANPGSSDVANIEVGNWPYNNVGHTGMCGPQVRTKTKRRIRRNERIWFTASVTGFDFANLGVTGTQPQQPHVDILMDLRICGRMRRSKQDSSVR